MNTGLGQPQTADVESEIVTELTCLEGSLDRTMTSLTSLVSRLTPLIRVEQPAPTGPDKKLETVLSPLGERIRKSKKVTDQLDEILVSLLVHLAI